MGRDGGGEGDEDGDGDVDVDSRIPSLLSLCLNKMIDCLMGVWFGVLLGA